MDDDSSVINISEIPDQRRNPIESIMLVEPNTFNNSRQMNNNSVAGLMGVPRDTFNKSERINIGNNSVEEIMNVPRDIFSPRNSPVSQILQNEKSDLNSIINRLRTVMIANPGTNKNVYKGLIIKRMNKGDTLTEENKVFLREQFPNDPEILALIRDVIGGKTRKKKMHRRKQTHKKTKSKRGKKRTRKSR
jgi:hypothetical protein